MSLLSALMLATWMALVYVVAYSSSPGCVCVCGNFLSCGAMAAAAPPPPPSPSGDLHANKWWQQGGGQDDDWNEDPGDDGDYDMSVVDVRPCKKCKHMYSYIRAGGCLNINCCLASLVEEGSPAKEGSPLKKCVQTCCVTLFFEAFSAGML